MRKQAYLDLYNASNKNASALLRAGELLCDKGYFSQAYVLGFSALEEIAKGQFAADVYTGLKTEEDFRSFFKDHAKKIANAGWAHEDASRYPYNLKWVGPDMDDVEKMTPMAPLFAKRQKALYVDVDFEGGSISEPGGAITEKDARDILHVVDVALQRIWEITGEFGGMQIGTKGFMK